MLHPRFATPLFLAAGLLAAVAAKAQTWLGTDDFNDNQLTLQGANAQAPGQWRFSVPNRTGGTGGAWNEVNQRLEFTASGEVPVTTGLLGWISPSTSLTPVGLTGLGAAPYAVDWSVAVDATNEVPTPAAGFASAGVEVYTLASTGAATYWGVYLVQNTSGSVIVAERARWNNELGDFDRDRTFAPVPAAVRARLRLRFEAASKRLAADYSLDGGATFATARVFDLDGADAGPEAPAGGGLGVELAGVSDSAGPIASGQLYFDNFAVQLETPPGIPPFFDAENFDDNDLGPVGVGQRWRFDAGDSGTVFTNQGGRLDYGSGGDGRRFLGWASPSSSGRAYEQGWVAEVDVRNRTAPATGFTYAGVDAYVVLDTGAAVTSSAYYGVYFRTTPGGDRAIVADWGRWDPERADFNRQVLASVPVAADEARLRLSWNAVTKEMTAAFSVAGAEFVTVGTFALAEDQAPLGPPFAGGFGLELVGLTNLGSGAVATGDISFDNLNVSPGTDDGGFFGADDFADGLLATGRYERVATQRDAAWNERNGRLEFTADARAPEVVTSDRAQQIVVWSNQSEGNTSLGRSWRAEVTATLRREPVLVNGAAVLGLEVTMAGTRSGYYGVYVLQATSGARIFTEQARWNGTAFVRTLLGSTGTLDPTFDTTDVRLRIAYDAVTQRFVTSFSFDGGATFQDYSTAGGAGAFGAAAAGSPSAWASPPENGFGLQLYGALYGNGLSAGPLQASGDAWVDDLAVEVTPMSFATWLEASFPASLRGQAEISGPAADANGDGVPNLLAFLFGLDPVGPGAVAAELPAVGAVAEEGNSYLTYTYRRVRRPYLVEVLFGSEDLITWEVIDQRVLAVVDNGDGTETVTVRDEFPLPVVGRRFLRLEVREP